MASSNDFIAGLEVVLIDFHATLIHKRLKEFIQEFHDSEIAMNGERPVFLDGIQWYCQVNFL